MNHAHEALDVLGFLLELLKAHPLALGYVLRDPKLRPLYERACRVVERADRGTFRAAKSPEDPPVGWCDFCASYHEGKDHA